MKESMRETLWKQLGASIDMLENALKMCPAEQWDTDTKFWYMAYHCLFYLDYYLTLDPKQFLPTPPFTLSEFDPNGAMPDRVYSKEELLDYLEASRKKCRTLVISLTEDIAGQRWADDYKNYSVFEMLLYNMRHVQHHAAQLNLLLRQTMDDAPKWVSQTRAGL